MLIKDAGKLTMGQPLIILDPRAVKSLIRQLLDHWLSNARMTHYQSLLLDADRVCFGPAVTLNPAMLLPIPEGPVPHDCQQTLAEMQGTRPDLTDQPLKGADLTWYTDRSSYLLNGEKKARAVVMNREQVI